VVFPLKYKLGEIWPKVADCAQADGTGWCASGASRSGTVVAWADGTARPVANSLSYGAARAAASAGLIPVGTDGAIDLFNTGASAVTLTVDLTGGYYRYPSVP